MFRIENNVPEVYTQESRDFQLFCRLYDIVFQASRFSINSMQDVSSTKYCNDRVLSGLQSKVGFFDSTRIDNRALRIVLNAYPHIIKYKGTKHVLLLVQNVFNQVSINAIERIDIDEAERDIHIVINKSTPYIENLLNLMKSLVPTGYTVSYDLRVYIDIDIPEFVTKDVVEFVHPKTGDHLYDDNDKEKKETYNVVTDTYNTSVFGSRLSTSQVISYSDWKKFREEMNSTEENT